MLVFVSKMLKNIFGTQNERVIRKFDTLIAEINDLENEFSVLSDQEIKSEAVRVRSEIARECSEKEEDAQKVREAIAVSISDQERNKHKKT